MAERLRAATPADGAALAAIDAVCNPSPWSAEAFAETLARAPGLLATDDDDCACGFVVVSIVADECEILDLGVLPAARRRGLGRELLRAALDQAARAGARRCHLEVRASNAAAQALYAGCGFVLDGRRRDYYRDGAGGREDALLLSRELDGATP
jgi:ribosomal-protein-alanine N-acetyltransferase